MIKGVNLRKIMIIFLWIYIAYFLYNKRLITLDDDSIISYINKSPNYTKLLFIALASVRVFIFIPGVVFMIVGGTLFGPYTGFLLSMISIVISESLVYFLSKIFNLKAVRARLSQKYPYIEPLILEYNYKFLSLGIITPIAPTDVICFLSGLCGIRYLRYIITVIIANIPMTLLYSSVGDSFGNSFLSSLLVIFSIISCCVVTIQIWHKLKNDIPKKEIFE